jgi:hypothetical protein
VGEGGRLREKRRPALGVEGEKQGLPVLSRERVFPQGARTWGGGFTLLRQGEGCRGKKVLKIRVARKGQAQGVYVGRPTLLGNPFRLENEVQRDQVVNQYATWLQHQIRRGNPEVIRALEELYRTLKLRGNITLLCFCAPRRCHGEIIAEHLKRRAEAEGFQAQVEVVGRR